MFSSLVLPPPLKFPPAASLVGSPSASQPLRGAAGARYTGAVGPDPLQMSSCHVVTWHLERIPGGIQFELIDYTPATKCCYISEMQESPKSQGGRRGE